MDKPKLIYVKIDGSWYLGKWDATVNILKDAQYIKRTGETEGFRFWITNKALGELSDLKLEGQITTVITKSLTKKEKAIFLNLIDEYNLVEETAMARLVNDYFLDD